MVMRFSSPTPSTLRWLLACSLLALSCAGNPKDLAQQRFTLGEAYFDKKQFNEAIIEYRNALQKQPTHAQARLKLARAYVALDDYGNAYREYLRAADLLPDNLEAQVEVGNMLLLGRKYEDAKNRARAIIQKNPSHLGALILL